MRYTIDTSGLEHPVIAIVGCGGTGGFVAEGVCRLLGDRQATLALIDPDRVEPHNLRRQAFYECDLGKFKSKVLAERLMRNYGRPVAYSVYPYSSDHHRPMFGRYGGSSGIVIGCVDNPEARKAIAQEVADRLWWIDSGNGENSGQVLIGNTIRGESLKRSFHEDAGVCVRLPLPTVQVPELLMPVVESAPAALDCAEAVEVGGQSPVINEVMAGLVKQFVHRLLTGTLSWMGIYVDLDLGTLRPVEANPAAVARISGLSQKALVTSNGYNPRRLCPNCGRYHARGEL